MRLSISSSFLKSHQFLNLYQVHRIPMPGILSSKTDNGDENLRAKHGLVSERQHVCRTRVFSIVPVRYAFFYFLHTVFKMILIHEIVCCFPDSGCSLDTAPVYGVAPPSSACLSAVPLGAYASSSSVCRAAMHAGVLTNEGGEFNAVIVQPQSIAPCASLSNGMLSVR